MRAMKGGLCEEPSGWGGLRGPPFLPARPGCSASRAAAAFRATGAGAVPAASLQRHRLTESRARATRGRLKRAEQAEPACPRPEPSGRPAEGRAGHYWAASLPCSPRRRTGSLGPGWDRRCWAQPELKGRGAAATPPARPPALPARNHGRDNGAGQGRCAPRASAPSRGLSRCPALCGRFRSCSRARGARQAAPVRRWRHAGMWGKTLRERRVWGDWTRAAVSELVGFLIWSVIFSAGRWVTVLSQKLVFVIFPSTAPTGTQVSKPCLVKTSFTALPQILFN